MNNIKLCIAIKNSNFQLLNSYIYALGYYSVKSSYPFYLSDLVVSYRVNLDAISELIEIERNDVGFNIIKKYIFHKIDFRRGGVIDFEKYSLTELADALYDSRRFRGALLCYSLAFFLEFDVFTKREDHAWAEIGVARVLHNAYGVNNYFTNLHAETRPNLFQVVS